MANENEIDDGGQFHSYTVLTREQLHTGAQGISRRDWLAGLAMQAIFAGVGAQQVADRDKRYDETNWKEIVASNSYEMADAMIKKSKEK